MKMHIDVDDRLGLIHCITTTPANEHDITQVDKLLHGEEQLVWGGASFKDIEKREEHKLRRVNWFVAECLGKVAALPAFSILVKTEKIKASVRAKVEHPPVICQNDELQAGK